MQSTENKHSTHVDVDAIRARADAATEGPWDHLPYDDVTQAMSLAERTGPHEWQRVGIVPAEHIRNDDAEFIAHARTDVPDLLAALAAERDRADRAELLIRDAPHESWCASNDWGNDLNPDDAPPCDCWKSEATA